MELKVSSLSAGKVEFKQSIYKEINKKKSKFINMMTLIKNI